MSSPILLLLLTALAASAAGAEELGPPQVCRCYSAGAVQCPTPETSPSGTVSATASVSATPPAKPARCTSGEKMKVTITFVADDGAELFVCGRSIYRSSNFDERQSFTYEDMCGDLLFRVTNAQLSSALSVQLDLPDGRRFGTTADDNPGSVDGTAPLYATVKRDASDGCFTDPASCDFGAWTPAKYVPDVLSGDPPNFTDLLRMGAFPIGLGTDYKDAGTYGLRIANPLCA